MGKISKMFEKFNQYPFTTGGQELYKVRKVKMRFQQQCMECGRAINVEEHLYRLYYRDAGTSWTNRRIKTLCLNCAQSSGE